MMPYVIGYFALFAIIYLFAYRWEWKKNKRGVKQAFHLILFLPAFLIGIAVLNRVHALIVDLIAEWLK
ncbi:hypothetical protein [Sabulibacter ruber]|uniref:hypothetical protein n=1 Tax=Sabulibacter ruber TaxID=2811901 RepID=UPI001A97D1CB|nr:hypothetical protein [Sabulibacter ruber]